ncbi:9360_t:CDS:10 [Gigaspora margarita]|uniref:9360_t:CDS:1 n=1 Tax=Gigaspora margarita TaxID=4874 RepID=A0ABN7V6N8_GIGMA|nr:9360_t:CDS:10 [Gigaspora margarita]
MANFLTILAGNVDARSIYVSKVNCDITIKDLSDHFQSCGDILKIRIIRKIFDNKNFDNNVVGYAFIEFKEESDVERALALDGSILKDEYKIMVRRKFSNVRTIYVSNFRDDITKDELSDHFQSHGDIIDITINDGKDGGKYAFICFATKAMAEDALKANNSCLGGRQIHVSRRFPSDNSIKILNISELISPADLRRHFKKCGKTKQVSIFDGRSSRYAIMDFIKPFSVQKALRKDNTILKKTRDLIQV